MTLENNPFQMIQNEGRLQSFGQEVSCKVKNLTEYDFEETFTVLSKDFKPTNFQGSKKDFAPKQMRQVRMNSRLRHRICTEFQNRGPIFFMGPNDLIFFPVKLEI